MSPTTHKILFINKPTTHIKKMKMPPGPPTHLILEQPSVLGDGTLDIVWPYILVVVIYPFLLHFHLVILFKTPTLGSYLKAPSLGVMNLIEVNCYNMLHCSNIWQNSIIRHIQKNWIYLKKINQRALHLWGNNIRVLLRIWPLLKSDVRVRVAYYNSLF